jgi:hypothetical protein
MYMPAKDWNLSSIPRHSLLNTGKQETYDHQETVLLYVPNFLPTPPTHRRANMDYLYAIISYETIHLRFASVGTREGNPMSKLLFSCIINAKITAVKNEPPAKRITNE